MTKGFVLFAVGEEYLKQAYLCAMSIRATGNSYPVSVVTCDTVPTKYKRVFDQIIDIPCYKKDDSRFQTAHRWKIYDASPYEHTIVLDTDILVLQNLDTWWNFLETRDVYYLDKAYTYRKQPVTSDYYRKAFTANKLPSIYNGIHFFKKCKTAQEFYKWLEIIATDWKPFYEQHCKEYCPKIPSMDISVSIASKILDCYPSIVNKNAEFPMFIHMKPYAQNWQNPTESWQNKVGVYFTDDLQLKIGNHLQNTVFHYTENSFVTDKILLQYEQFLGLQHE